MVGRSDVLKGIFSRLLILMTKKMAIVTYMFSLSWEEGGEAWKWWRQFLAWEKEQVIECCILLHPIVLQVNVSNMWMQLHASSKFNISSACNYLFLMGQNYNIDHSFDIRRFL